MTKQYVVVYNNDSKCIVEIPDGAVFTLGPGIPGSKGPWMFRVYADPKRKQCIYACAATAFRRTDVLVMSAADLNEKFEARKDIARTNDMMHVAETVAKEMTIADHRLIRNPIGQPRFADVFDNGSGMLTEHDDEVTF